MAACTSAGGGDDAPPPGGAALAPPAAETDRPHAQAGAAGAADAERGLVGADDARRDEEAPPPPPPARPPPGCLKADAWPKRTLMRADRERIGWHRVKGYAPWPCQCVPPSLVDADAERFAHIPRRDKNADVLIQYFGTHDYFWGRAADVMPFTVGVAKARHGCARGGRFGRRRRLGSR